MCLFRPFMNTSQELGVDDGVFWVGRDEFFQYFKTVYLCARDMTQFN
jgi:hypothetical protein